MNRPEGQAAIEKMDTAIIEHHFSLPYFKEKIMAGFNRNKIIGIALIISSLLVLLSGYEKNGFEEEVGVEIDNVVENIAERIKIESDRLINDRPDENIGEEPDEAAEYAGEIV